MDCSQFRVVKISLGSFGVCFWYGLVCYLAPLPLRIPGVHSCPFDIWLNAHRMRGCVAYCDKNMLRSSRAGCSKACSCAAEFGHVNQYGLYLFQEYSEYTIIALLVCCWLRSLTYLAVVFFAAALMKRCVQIKQSIRACAWNCDKYFIKDWSITHLWRLRALQTGCRRWTQSRSSPSPCHLSEPAARTKQGH